MSLTLLPTPHPEAPKEKLKSIYVRESIHTALKTKAAREGVSLTDLCERPLQGLLSAGEPQNGEDLEK